ncbi:MAG TPA: RDD family protein [Trebonia sp.]|nr:RDD family protein [Trebonia sp.]
MSTMPEGDGAGQQGGAQHGTHPGAPQQAGAPSQEQDTGFTQDRDQGLTQGQDGTTAGGPAPAQSRGQAPGGDAGDGGYGGDAAYPAYLGGMAPPVMRAETRVTGRRVVQYLIDAFLVGLIPSLISIPFDRSDSTFIHVLGGIVAFAVFVLIGFLYWVLLTKRQDGQTLGMKLLGLRVISKGGGPASTAQLTIRWVCLIVDAIPYTWPFTGLVGFIVILCSRDRQRIGDHLARTLVVRSDFPVSGGPRHTQASEV